MPVPIASTFCAEPWVTIFLKLHSGTKFQHIFSVKPQEPWSLLNLPTRTFYLHRNHLSFPLFNRHFLAFLGVLDSIYFVNKIPNWTCLFLFPTLHQSFCDGLLGEVSPKVIKNNEERPRRVKKGQEGSKRFKKIQSSSRRFNRVQKGSDGSTRFNKVQAKF